MYRLKLEFKPGVRVKRLAEQKPCRLDVVYLPFTHAGGVNVLAVEDSSHKVLEFHRIVVGYIHDFVIKAVQDRGRYAALLEYAQINLIEYVPEVRRASHLKRWTGRMWTGIQVRDPAATA